MTFHYQLNIHKLTCMQMIQVCRSPLKIFLTITIKDLTCLKIWLAGNKLSINVAKTNSFVIGSRKKLKDIKCPLTIKPSFAIRGAEISIIEHTKYLGVQVDQYMNWENHINHVIKKISRALGMIRLAKNFFPLTTLQILYKSIVEPYFRFYCPVWETCRPVCFIKKRVYHGKFMFPIIKGV